MHIFGDRSTNENEKNYQKMRGSKSGENMLL